MAGRAAIAALCVVVAAGCSSPGTNRGRAEVPGPVAAADRAVLRKAVATTQAAGNARVSMSVTMTGLVAEPGGSDRLPGHYNLAGTGRVEFDSGNSSMHVSTPYLDELTGGGSRVEQRIVGDATYLKLPAPLLLEAGAQPEATWIARDTQAAAATDLSALAHEQSDPIRQLERLGTVGDGVVGVGKESVRGVLTTLFRGTATVRGAQVPVEAWIDAEGLVRRMIVTVPLDRIFDGSGVTDAATIRVQQDLYDFGTAAPVTAPPRTRTATTDSITLRAP